MAVDSIDNTPALVVWRLIEDDTASFTLSFTDADGDAMNVADRSWSAQILTPRDTQAAPVTIDTTNAATGALVLTVDNADTDGLGGDRLRWELVQTLNGEPRTVLSGPCEVSKPGFGARSSTPTNTAQVQFVTDTTVSVTTALSAEQLAIDGGTADSVYGGSLPSFDGGTA